MTWKYEWRYGSMCEVGGEIDWFLWRLWWCAITS